MKQLTQKLKDGQMKILEVPLPVLTPGTVLVKNYYSLISVGTEGSTVSAARKSLAGKAKERPQQVKQVFEILRKQGPVQTYRTVMKKLDAYSPLGYSCTGEILDVAQDVKGFTAGDMIACGGISASHAEVVAVPVNLCVKVNPDTDLRSASYNTLGAIAMQGIRQADLRLGEICAVIGLGLIGQLTCLILRASGVRVIGIDIDQKSVDIASQYCADLALLRNMPGIEEKVEKYTEGIGVDTVIITAATNSLDPINFAGRLSRKKGKVVVVGNIPTGFDREQYYKKELELRMSCSYGPGRYDPVYEEKGIDYPVAYVRWTEKRNMQAFQDLIYSGKIDLSYLTTHVFDLADAPNAYDMILKRKEFFLGILIKYPSEKEPSRDKIIVTGSGKTGKVHIGFVGAGSYAMSYLLPNIPRDKDFVLKGVLTSTGASSRSVAERFKFEFCTSEEKDIFENPEINTVFIATRHNTHSYYFKKALEAGKNVFVEKPLCLNESELEDILQLYSSIIATNCRVPIVMVGYNRRFSPLTEILRKKIGTGTMSMIYRVNAGFIPADSWIQDVEVGGGRIIGEVCHFIDYLTYINGSLPVSVYAAAMKDAQGLNDTANISLSFKNGSIGTISYFANGSKYLPKEYIEIYSSGITGVITDFKKLEIFAKGKDFAKSLITQDKGQKRTVVKFLDAAKKGGPSLIPFDEIYTVMLTTFMVVKSLKTGELIKIER